MKLLYYISAIVLIGIVDFSCTKPDVPLIFAQKHWVLQSLTINPQVTIGAIRTGNLWELVQTECTEDDSYFFAANHQILVYDNQIQCSLNSYTVKGQWQYGTTDNHIDIFIDQDLSYTAQIVKHTDDQLILEVPGIAYGFTGAYLVQETYKLAGAK